ncbi:hypothetical protein BUE65_22010, partial [Klebsiella variicola]
TRPQVQVEAVPLARRETPERADAARRDRSQAMAPDGQKYRDENREKEGVNSTESGLQFRVLTQGEGPIPARTDRVHAVGTCRDRAFALGQYAELQTRFGAIHTLFLAVFIAVFLAVGGHGLGTIAACGVRPLGGFTPGQGDGFYLHLRPG